jgi:UrcA family protein
MTSVNQTNHPRNKESVMKTFNHTTKFAAVSVAVLGLGFFAAGAQAGEAAQGANSVTVRYSDLDLNTAAGAKVLYQRIHSAAERVCGDVNSRQLDQAAAAKACLDQAVANSVHAVKNEQFTNIASQHGYGVRREVILASAR